MSVLMNLTQTYRGRFAPSPSGHLHFGSLIAALASYLDAKAHQGTWLVRIEDIDPPRELKGASTQILKTLEHYGLFWDESVLYQSQQTQYYEDILHSLSASSLSYYCQCTRANIKDMGGIYSGHCKELKHTAKNSAIRVVNTAGIHSYDDLIQGNISTDTKLAKEDFIIKRRDNLFAYQLAVVLDELFQNITHVIRGCDLLEPTTKQLSLFKILNKQKPKYGHLPLAIDVNGYKLSKQNKSLAINNHNPQPTLIAALTFLGQNPPPELHGSSVAEIITWGVNHWDRKIIPNDQKIVFPQH